MSVKRLQALEAKRATIMAKELDQTVIEDILGHTESYGVDLNRMIDPTLHSEALRDPAKVAEAVLHKGTSRFDWADDLWRQAEAATGWEKECLQAHSVSEMMEGCRQLTKIFELLKSRDAQRHVFSKIPADLKKAVEIVRNLDGVTVKLSEAEAALSKMGYTFRSLAKAVSDAVIQIG